MHRTLTLMNTGMYVLLYIHTMQWDGCYLPLARTVPVPAEITKSSQMSSSSPNRSSGDRGWGGGMAGGGRG